MGNCWPGGVSAGAAHCPGRCLPQEDQGELRGSQERRYTEWREGGLCTFNTSVYSHKEYNSLVMTLLKIHVKSSKLDKKHVFGPTCLH